MLKLIDLIQHLGVTLDDYKIHCASGYPAAQEAMNAFRQGHWKEWQEDQNQKNFNCKQILSLIHQGGSSWLFAGVFEVVGVKETESAASSKYRYDTREVTGLETLTGRAIVDFKKGFRNPYPNGSTCAEELFISEIRRERISLPAFPGYSNVRLDFLTLQMIFERHAPDWNAALANLRGVYLISDKKTGMLYVGSASGSMGIWQRWKNYLESGDGGNKKLIELIEKEGLKRQHEFQFSLLEIFGNNIEQSFIKEREDFWKDVLLTRNFGLNSN